MLNIGVTVLNRVKGPVDPESQERGDACHFDQDRYEVHKPELELDMSSWHHDNSRDVPDEEDLQKCTSVLLTIEASFFVGLQGKEVMQVLEAPLPGVFTDEEVEDVEEQYADL